MDLNMLASEFLTRPEIVTVSTTGVKKMFRLSVTEPNDAVNGRNG